MQTCLSCNETQTDKVFCDNCKDPKEIHPAIPYKVVENIYMNNFKNKKLILTIINTPQWSEEHNRLVISRAFRKRVLKNALALDLVSKEGIDFIIKEDPYMVKFIKNPTIEHFKVLLTKDLLEINTNKKIPLEAQTELLQYCLENNNIKNEFTLLFLLITGNQNMPDTITNIEGNSRLNTSSLILLRNFLLTHKPDAYGLHLELIHAHKNFSLTTTLLDLISPNDE